MNGKYRIVITRDAQRDKEKVKTVPALKNKVDKLLTILKENPWQNPPPYEKLQGSLSAYCSRRINRQHRLVYIVYEQEKTVKIVSMWTHYECGDFYICYTFFIENVI